MESKATAKIDPAQAAETLIDFFAQVGRAMNTPLYRVVLHRDGQGEAEFQALNPTECLVLKWENPADLTRLTAGLEVGDEEKVVYRKKCIKCLMHERPAGFRSGF
jgi:hypothetical protein